MRAAGSAARRRCRVPLPWRAALCGVLGLLGLLGVTGVLPAAAQPRTLPDARNLDGLGAVPEWLHVLAERALPGRGLTVWVPGGTFEASSLVRVPRFPSAPIEAWPADSALVLRGARNEYVSAQLAVIGSEALRGLRATAADLHAGPATISAAHVDVRFVGYVPVVRAQSELTWSARFEDVAGAAVSGTRAPDVVADPLVPLPQVDVPALRAQPLWFTIRVPPDAAPGRYTGTIRVEAEGHPARVLPLVLHVERPLLPDPADFAFHLDVWMNPAAVAEGHGVAPWSDAHWALLDTYLRDLAARGQRKITATILENPWPVAWRGGQMRAQTATPYASLVRWTRRADGTWHFDFERFDRYVETALRAGVGPYVGLYSMLVFHGPQRFTYFDEARGEVVSEEAALGSERWEAVWKAFLPRLRDHLRAQGWLAHAYLAFDERPAAEMARVARLVGEAAPELAANILIAGTADVSPYAADLSLPYNALPEPDTTGADAPDAACATRPPVAAQRAEAGRRTLFYTAGTPAHPNTFSFSPAVEARVLPWVALCHGLDGYLRWAYNDWPPDVYGHPTFFYVQGDEYFVYPGPGGPVSSIRWELLRDGIEDVALARALHAAGRLDAATVQRAARLATRTPDGRHKDVRDLVRARLLLSSER